MNNMLKNAVSVDFASNGYVVVPSVVSESDLNPIIDRISKVVDQKAQQFLADGKIKDLKEDKPFEKRWFEVCRQLEGGQDVFGWHKEVFCREIYELIKNPKILDVIEILIGNDIQANGDCFVRPTLFQEKVTTLPWHQDSAYMPQTENDLYLTLWMPLVEVNEKNGSLEMIPGSHLDGFKATKQVEGEAFAVPVEDPCKGKEPVVLQMKPGDLVVFNNLTYHRSYPNSSQVVRWSVDFRYSPIGTPLYNAWHAHLSFDARSKNSSSNSHTWSNWQKQWEAVENK